MKTENKVVLAAAILVLIALTGVAVAAPTLPRSDVSSTAAVVSDAISYQGRLTSPSGAPLDGTYTMRFVVYDADAGGSALWDSGSLDVAVEDGLFTVQLGIDPNEVNGQALWLSIIVEGETLSPRQEILPAPYALSLRPGADIVGDSISGSDAVLSVTAPISGTGLYAGANEGVGVFGSSFENYGGYFQSNSSQAVRGEAGDIQDVVQPFGMIGVAGLGNYRGVYGASVNGVGLYGTSQNHYAGYFYSEDYRGVYSSSEDGYYAGYFTNRGGSTNPGLFINGTLVASGSKSGYVVDISQNGGADPLETGDVVAVVGVSDPVIGEIPVMQVVKASAANAGAVVGVVDQRFLVVSEDGVRLVQPDPDLPRISTDNPIQNGEYLSVVTLGVFKVIKADASSGSIQPGDLLTPSELPGYVMKAVAADSGTIIGKALEALESGQGEIAVYITLQ